MSENGNWSKSGPVAVLLAILTFLGVRSFTSDSSPSSDAPAAAPGQSRHEDGAEREDAANEDRDRKRFWQPLREFLTTRAPSDLAKEIANARHGLAEIDDWEIRYLIACVPDPVDSTSGHRFDGLIDSIQRAAETQGYVYDRNYYPWPKRKTVADRRVKIKADGTLKADKSGSRNVHLLAQSGPDESEDGKSLEEPGLLLLRDSKARRLLLVFLVGETATAGLKKDAFAASLEVIKRTQHYRDTHLVPVLGPHFSGSQTSLQQSLRALVQRELLDYLLPIPDDPLRSSVHLLANVPTFRIISGSASSINKQEMENCAPPAQVCFHATVVPGNAIMGALYEYLKLGKAEGEGFCFRDNFAILCESNTSFGQRIKQRATTNNEVGPTVFPFPLHVSEVRSAYDKLTGSGRDNALRLPSFGIKLPLPMRRSNSARDVEPSLDPAMTAVTTERLLTQMLETIARERFRYVFIVATDIQDRLFLASLVRQQCPESRLVFFDADLLFTHPDYSSVLRGSIVGSSYPLYARDQHWSFPFDSSRRRQFFPGPAEQGYYNATIFLLEQKHVRFEEWGPPYRAHESLVEYGPPFPKLYRSFPYHPPPQPCPKDASDHSESEESVRVDERCPPVWISIVGVGGLYPVAVVPARITRDQAGNVQDPFKDYVHPADANTQTAARFRLSHPGLWIVPVIGMTLLMLYVTCCYLVVLLRQWHWRDKTESERGDPMRKLFWPRSADRFVWRQKVYVAVCLLSVLFVYGYLVFVWLLPLYRSQPVDGSPVQVRPWQWIAPAVLLYVLEFVFITFAYRLILGVASLIEEPRRLLRILKQILGEPPVLWISLALILPAAAYLSVNWGSPRPWQPGEALLFAERATALASGVSPVVPVFFLGLAFFTWSYAHLNRLYLLDNHPAHKPCPAGGEPLTQIARCHHELTREILRPKQAILANRWTFLFWIIVVLLFFAYSRLSVHFIPSVEGMLTESLLLMSFIVLSTLILYAWLHLCQVWHSLSHLLDALLRLPLGAAYERIPDAIRNLFRPYLFASKSSARAFLDFSSKPEPRVLLHHRLEQHRLLVEEYVPLAGHLNTAAALPAAIKNQLDDALAGTLNGPQRLTRSAQACLAVLLHVDKNYSANVTPVIRDWLDRAEEFVAVEVAVYLGQFFAQLRNLIIYVSVLPVLFLLAVTSYPFQPQRLWLLFGVTLIGLVTFSVLWIIFQIERNALVSRIIKTTPNQLNFHWTFLSHVLLYAVPLLGIVVAASSDVSDLVHSWIDPLLQLMK